MMDTFLGPVAVSLIDSDAEEPALEPSTPARYREGKIDTAGWDNRLSAITRYLLLYPFCVGWDALAGYTFSHVARNYGEYCPFPAPPPSIIP